MRAPLSILNGLTEIGTFFEQKKVDTYVCSEDMTREEIAPLGKISVIQIELVFDEM